MNQAASVLGSSTADEARLCYGMLPAG